MSWFLTFLFLMSPIFNNSPSEASHDEKKQQPSAVVVGTVFCDTCFQQDFSHSSHFISGASVGVECKDGSSNSKPSFQTEVKTDSHGVFKVHFPFSVSKHVKKIEGCSVKLISSSEPYCAVASAATSSSLHLKSRKEGTHIFSAGFFTFKPLKQPSLCNQKPSIQNSKEFNSQKVSFSPTDEISFPSPNKQTDLLGLPGLPGLSGLPGLPGLPGGPGVGLPGKTTTMSNSKTSKTGQLTDKKVAHPDTFFPPQIPGLPNPFQPPPLLPTIPNNPFQPPVGSAPLIPNPLPPIPGLTPPAGSAPLIPNLPPIPGLTPPAGSAPLIPNLPPVPGLTPPAGSAPLIPNLPPIPGLTPSPPSLPVLPPFPFPPVPRIPGIPPASSSSSKQTTTP